jgi:hypothetical protein
MILLFLDYIKNEGGDSAPNYLWDIFLAFLSVCMLVGGIMLEKYLDKRKEKAHKITGVIVLNKLLNRIITTLTVNIRNINDVQNATKDDETNISHLYEYSYRELDLVKTISSQDLYIGYITLFSDETTAILNYSNLLNILNLVERNLIDFEKIRDEFHDDVVPVLNELNLEANKLKSHFYLNLNQNGDSPYQTKLRNGYKLIDENYKVALGNRTEFESIVLIRHNSFIVPMMNLVGEDNMTRLYHQSEFLLEEYDSCLARFSTICNNWNGSLKSNAILLRSNYKDLTEANDLLNAELLRFKESAPQSILKRKFNKVKSVL